MNSETELEERMAEETLTEYAKHIIGDDVDRLVYLAGVSRATIYRILGGVVSKPETYQKLALSLGANRKEQREIYKKFMLLSGYLDFIDDDAVDRELDVRVLKEIQKRYPEIYQAAVMVVKAQERGELPRPDNE